MQVWLDYHLQKRRFVSIFFVPHSRSKFSSARVYEWTFLHDSDPWQEHKSVHARFFSAQTRDFLHCAFPDFHDLGNLGDPDKDDAFSCSLRFVARLYDQKKSFASSHHNINKLRVKLVTGRDASLVTLPPSEAALRQYILRASLHDSDPWQEHKSVHARFFSTQTRDFLHCAFPLHEHTRSRRNSADMFPSK
jgi:hypothetical protein